MNRDIRLVKTLSDLIGYFSGQLGWNIDMDDFDDIEDITYDFDAEDIGLKEEAFAKIESLRQLPPLIDGQKWGIFCVEFDSRRFEVTALRKILSGLIPRRRNSADHAVWDQRDLLFLCFWGEENERTIGVAHFVQKESGLPQIRMISCAPAMEDFTQIRVFENRLSKLEWPKDVSDIEGWRNQWADAFVSAYRQTITDASTLTLQLAAQAQHIRDLILDALRVESQKGYVHKLYDKFKDTLIHDMTRQQFADMYAQTVVYGLFSARCMSADQADFSATEAIEYIPNTNPFLKSLLRECLGTQSNSRLSFDELEIGDVVEILRRTKTNEIIRDFNRQTGGGREDPVIHFYEEFLTAYDKEQRVQRGVYYTPQSVVNFIVRAVDDILKSRFKQAAGLASTTTKTIKFTRTSLRKRDGYHREVSESKKVPSIQILDPAVGTGTFLRQTILQIYENFKHDHRGESDEQIMSAWNQYVPLHLLPRLNGFELMMAPYAVAHMKLAMVLKDTGYNFEDDSRFNVYLTNTLEEPGESDNQITIWDDPLAAESITANGVKKNNGINIVLGNPPYAGESANKGEWILKLVDAYKMEPGGEERLHERNPKWLNDDYVKFIRMAQWYVQRAERGIMAFICPHGFLDNPTFRGMRWNLGMEYDEIFVLDLHGNAKKRETAPDGSKDENVFDIQQGVCVAIMLRSKSRKEKFALVHHADLFGMREYKYAKLNELTVDSISWNEVSCQAPFYLFKPVQTTESTFERFDISKIFLSSVMGFQTHRDNFAIALNEATINERIATMRNSNISDQAISGKYQINDNRDWQIRKARQRLVNSSDADVRSKTTLCQYRLFDTRWCYLDEAFMDYPRGSVFIHVSNKSNYVLGIGRQGLAVGNIEWCLATVSKYAMDANIFRRGGVTASPLYLYSTTFGTEQRTPNLESSFLEKFQKLLGLRFTNEKTNAPGTFAPLDILDYIYAVLYSHRFRAVNADDLKIDYPKIPYPDQPDYFWTMVNFGKELRLLHTMEIPLSTKGVSFKGTGDNSVSKYSFKDGKIVINKTQFFESSSYDLESIWQYTIGGNQPLQKWMKDRKGTILDEEGIEHYKAIIVALSRTMDLMNAIDQKIKL